MKFALTTAGFILILFASSAFSQDLPSKIRGYKVYDTKVAIVNADLSTGKNEDANASVKLLKPKIASMGMTGVTVEVIAEMTSHDRSGSVDFLSFKDFRVNNIPIEIDEYTTPFDFKKGEKFTFTKPARISINTANIAKGVYKEFMSSKEDWAVTGTVFVFGKFKKFGIGFKRVIPVRIDLKFKNLLR